jgi:hypothetical protein
MSKYLQTSLAAMTHLAEGLCFNALLTLKAENSLHVPLKRLSTIILHGSTSQKTNLNFILNLLTSFCCEEYRNEELRFILTLFSLRFNLSYSMYGFLIYIL